MLPLATYSLPIERTHHKRAFATFRHILAVYRTGAPMRLELPIAGASKHSSGTALHLQHTIGPCHVPSLHTTCKLQKVKLQTAFLTKGLGCFVQSTKQYHRLAICTCVALSGAFLFADSIKSSLPSLQITSDTSCIIVTTMFLEPVTFGMILSAALSGLSSHHCRKSWPLHKQHPHGRQACAPWLLLKPPPP